MITLDPAVLQAWLAQDEPKPSSMDLASLRALAHGRLPESYVAFVTTYGFVEFGRDPQATELFTYTVDRDGQREVRQAVAGFLQDARDVATTYAFATTTDDADDESRPILPEGYLTIGRDINHGLILLDVIERPGRVLYQPRTDWRWGTEDNTWLGEVAPDFDSFISGLRPSAA
jgi:hypothetical protein